MIGVTACFPNVPILILSRDLRIRRFTPTATRVLNVIASDIGRPIGDITLNIHVADLEAMLADFMDSMSVKKREVQDREGHWYALRIRPRQKLDELLALEQAERRDAEQARVEAEAASRAKDHFLTMISHELRSLQGIVGRVEIIRRGVDRPQLEQALEAIDRAVARQARLVKDLLDISSLASGEIRSSVGS
jgi:two-component system, chemotaxis family, CheB/CheR fusion protein